MRRLAYLRSPSAAVVDQAALVAVGFLRHAAEDGSWQSRQHSVLIRWVRDASERALVRSIVGVPSFAISGVARCSKWRCHSVASCALHMGRSCDFLAHFSRIDSFSCAV